MSEYLDYKYINLLSPSLERFSWKRGNIASCRCPICGDSHKNKLKTRFYFFKHKDSYLVKCHNCGYSNSFRSFLQSLNNILYREYSLESFNDSYGNRTKREHIFIVESIPKFQNSVLYDAEKISNLQNNHVAKKYLIDRQIPTPCFDDLYFTDNFAAIADKISTKTKHPSDSRILIPFRTLSGDIFAIQGRSIDPTDNLRYITVRYDEDTTPKIYGLNKINPSLTNYCVEGPFDSMFLDNAFAMAGSGLNPQSIPFNTDNTIFIYDNEPRNKEIINFNSKMIDAGKKICVWPSFIKEKDINDMVKKYNIDYVKGIINSRIYSGLTAKLKLNEWRK